MIRKLSTAAALGVAALGLSACATGLNTQVSRYQAMPAPTGQTFYVVPAEAGQGGLEFGRYASLVAQNLEARGYRPAGAPQAADMIVKIDYGVDRGTQEIEVDPFYRSRFGYGDPFFNDPFWGPYYGRPFYSRYGYWGARSPFYYGWGDPFYGYRDPIRSRIVYKSFLDMDIVRKSDNASLFEGHAKARSSTAQLGTLVPNLVEAMFTGFPGRSGETVRITVPAQRRG